MTRKVLVPFFMALICFSSMAQDVDRIMAGMTLRQKVAQLFVPSVTSVEFEDRQNVQIEWVKEGIGGLIVMDGHLLPCMETINELQDYASIPLMISIDGEWGASMRFPEFPYFPRQMQLGALKSDKLVYKMGRAVGKELRLINIGVNYAPDIDINCNPANPVINTRSFGENREKVAAYGSAYARGMQDEGVSACVKHFPGHGDTAVDSHKGLPVLEFGLDRLDSLELYPFRRCIADGVDMVMLAHLSVPALDPTGIPTSVSKPVVTGLLREKLGFDGLIVTDALGMAGVLDYFGGSGPQACLAAYEAGVDVLLMPHDLIGSIDLIQSKIESGELSEAGLDGRVRKILTQKMKHGMLSDSYSGIVDTEGLADKADNPDDRKLIAQISEKTVVTVVKPSGRMLRGNVAYLALGAGTEKKVPTMDEDDPNIPRKDGKGGPADYGARRGVGKSGASAMGDIFAEKAGADCFYLDRNFSLDDLRTMRGKLSGYRTVILGFHDTDSRPQNNYGITDQSIYDYVGEWASEQDLVGVYFGSPYALDVMPWYRDFRAFLIGWADNVYNCSAAAKVVCGKLRSTGVLPVRAGGLPAGYRAK